MKRALLLSAAICGCGAPDVLPFDPGAKAGELVIAAVAGANGEVLRTGSIVHGDALLAIPVEADATLYSWTLSSEDLLGADPAAVLLKATSDAGGACGRCLAPAERAPQLLHPGSSCALADHPRAMRYTAGAGAEKIEHVDRAIREQLRLELPGECPCPSGQSVIEPAPFSWERIGPDRSSLPHQRVTIGEDGTLGMFSDDHAVSIDAGGTRAARDGDLELEGPVRDAIGLGPDHFLLYTYHREAGMPSPFVVLDHRLETITARLLIDHDPTRMRLFEGGALLIGRKQSAPKMELLACSIAQNRTRCAAITPELPYDGAFRDAARTDNGAVVAIGAVGFAYGRRGANGAWEWIHEAQLADPPRPRTLDGIELESFFELAASGDRVFLCARAKIVEPELPAMVHVFTASVALDRAPVWRALWSAPAARCEGFTRLSNGDLLLDTGPNSGALLSADGTTASAVSPGAILGIDRPVRSLSPGYAIAHDGAVFRIGRDGDRAVLADGPAITGAPAVDDLIAAPDGFYAVMSPGFVQKISYTEDGLVAEAPRALDGIRGDSPILHAARDSTNGALLLAGYTRDATITPALHRVDPNTASAIELSLPIDRGALIDITEASPGEFAIITADQKILWLDRDRDTARELPIDWDDPRTETVETAPNENAECRKRRFFEPSSTFQAIDGAHGIAWAVGCEGAIVRANRAYAERVAIDEAPDLTAVRALCADNAIAGASAEGDPQRGLGRLFELYSAGQEYARRSNSGHENTPPIAGLDSGAMVELIGDGAHLTEVFGSFSQLSAVVRLRDSGLRPHFAVDLRAAASDDRQTIVLGGPNGLLIFGTALDKTNN